MRNPGRAPIHYQRKHDYFKRQLMREHNFSVDYEAVGVLIDAKSKRIALTLDPEARPQIIICDFIDIRRWRSYSKGFETKNEYGATLSEFSKYFVSIYIKDPAQPRYDFFAINEIDADRWVARLDALVN